MACGCSRKSLGRFCCVTHSLDEDSDVCSPIFHRCEVVISQSSLTSTENEDLAKPEGSLGVSGACSARMELA